MSSSYNTRSASTASGSSITIFPTTDTTTTAQRRHFCIVLTNNPRMVQSAGRTLQNVIVHTSDEQGQQQQTIEPQVQQNVHLQVPLQRTQTPLRSRRRQGGVRTEQQVPMSSQPVTTTATEADIRADEKEIELNFKAQVQPILQMYLQKTHRSNPINSVFDMSNYVQV